MAKKITDLTELTAPASTDVIPIVDVSVSTTKKITTRGLSDGDGKPYVWKPPSSANACDDEFCDLSSQSGPSNGLDAKWSKHNLGTASWLVLDDSVCPGALLLSIPTGQSTDQHIYQTTPAGDFSVMAIFETAFISDRQMWGINILDTNGDGIGVCTDFSGNPCCVREIDNWQQTATSSSLVYNHYLGKVTFWLRKATNTYYGGLAVSDRLLANPEYTSLSKTFTPAYITFGRIFGTGVSRIVIDAFRVY